MTDHTAASVNRFNVSSTAAPPNGSSSDEQKPKRKFSFAGLVGGARRRSSNVPPQAVDANDSTIQSTVGFYGRTLRRFTNDALPQLDNYLEGRGVPGGPQRPTLEDLHEGRGKKENGFGDGEGGVLDDGKPKFGWMEGVLMRCLLNIWGVMLFLRLSWMVGQAGVTYTLVIIAGSTVVTFITTLSMSAVATNGEIGGGGIYYMISRTLGPEWGGAIGVVFSFANAGMTALNTVGFSESLIALLKKFEIQIIDGDKMDNRIYSVAALIIMQAIIIIGMEWEAKAQFVLLVTLLIAMANFVVGSVIGPRSDVQIAKGFIGLNISVLESNMGPEYTTSEGTQQNFWSIFALFFPSVAGIQAGVSISGDLRDPAEAIPKGTMWSIFLTSSSYALFAVIAAAGTLRQATGNVKDIGSRNSSAYWGFADCGGNKTCSYGLLNDYEVMDLMALVHYFTYAGCFAACLSSAMSCLVSAGKTFEVVCADGIFPYVSVFAKTWGREAAPIASYALCFLVAFAFIIIADLDTIAPLTSNSLLVAYALLNFCAFHACLIKPTGWRPSFKYYNTWVCLLGAVLCVASMILMDWMTTLVSLFTVFAIYLGLLYRNSEFNWGTSAQAQNYNEALSAAQALALKPEHVKNYRPQILCLSGHPGSRPDLVNLSFLITNKASLLMCANVLHEAHSSALRKEALSRGYKWLRSHDISSFYVLADGWSLLDGTKALIQVGGIGRLAPNVVLLGYKRDWRVCPRKELKEYFDTLHCVLDNNCGLAILRVQDLPKAIKEMKKTQSEASIGGGVDNIAVELGGDDSLFGPSEPTGVFTRKQGKGTIDVWWLYDDGGLTLLLPYLIQTRKIYARCKLRVFALSNKQDGIEKELRSMAALLSKFRIDYSDLTIVPDITKRADGKTRTMFHDLIAPFRVTSTNGGDEDQEEIIEESEIFALKEKTNRHLRLRELLLEHSMDASLIVMTLPVPKKGNVSAPMYLGWLEMLTHGMPPFMLIRGNQTSVLTFYS